MTMEAEVTVESIAAGGDGVARHEGRVVFIPRTAPGDVARVAFTPAGRFARGTLVRVVNPSADRVDAACPHYTMQRCGGCQLQHLSYDAQRRAKQRIVSDVIERIGRRTASVPEVRASPAQWRYRRKLTLTMRHQDHGWTAGLHRTDDATAIFALSDCLITGEPVVAIWHEVLRAAEYLPAERELRGAVAVLPDGASFLLESGEQWPTALSFFNAVPSVASLWWRTPRRGTVLLHARTPAHVPASSFAQVNAAVAEQLQAHVVGLAMAYQPRRVVDAYAGAGDTAIALATRGVRVAAIEVDEVAAAACRARLAAASTVIVGRVEEYLAASLPADVVIVNPPRTGLGADVAATLEQCEPRPCAVIYVSCDAATLGRDLTRLPGYRIASLQPFDMFPQTAHVETVCELVPEAA
jgi:23S rRNA (uracil1939-C5)-methyltransferase